jgi:hypothetical protein
MFEIKAGAFYRAATNLAGTSSWITATTQAAKDDQDRLFHEQKELGAQTCSFYLAGWKVYPSI